MSAALDSIADRGAVGNTVDVAHSGADGARSIPSIVGCVDCAGLKRIKVRICDTQFGDDKVCAAAGSITTKAVSKQGIVLGPRRRRQSNSNEREKGGTSHYSAGLQSCVLQSMFQTLK